MTTQSTMYRTIQTCAGIGDAIFLIKKLVNVNEKFHIQLPDGIPQRGHQIWDLLPKTTQSVQYVPGLSYKKLERQSAHRLNSDWLNIVEDSFSLSMNQWLEEGNRVEHYFPEIKTSHTINWQIKKWAEEVATDFPRISADTKAQRYIGIYASSYSTVRQWGFWDAKEWYKLIRLIHQERPTWTFVIIGAEWDNDIAKELMALLDMPAVNDSIPYINTIGKPLGYVANVMRYLDYGFYFTSGLPILSETIKYGSDLTMFFPPHLEKMMGTFCDPKRKASGQLKECLYCSPEAIYKWWTDFYQGYDRIEQTKGVL